MVLIVSFVVQLTAGARLSQLIVTTTKTKPARQSTALPPALTPKGLIPRSPSSTHTIQRQHPHQPTKHHLSTTTMPTYNTATTPHQAPYPVDWPLIWTVITVTGILLFQTLTIIALLHLQAVRRETYWKRLRDRGQVFVDGPMLIWARDLPPQPTFSTFTLHRKLHRSGSRMENGGV